MSTIEKLFKEYVMEKVEEYNSFDFDKHNQKITELKRKLEQKYKERRDLLKQKIFGTYTLVSLGTIDRDICYLKDELKKLEKQKSFIITDTDILYNTSLYACKLAADDVFKIATNNTSDGRFLKSRKVIKEKVVQPNLDQFINELYELFSTNVNELPQRYKRHFLREKPIAKVVDFCEIEVEGSVIYVETFYCNKIDRGNYEIRVNNQSETFLISRDDLEILSDDMCK